MGIPFQCVIYCVICVGALRKIYDISWPLAPCQILGCGPPAERFGDPWFRKKQLLPRDISYRIHSVNHLQLQWIYWETWNFYNVTVRIVMLILGQLGWWISHLALYDHRHMLIRTRACSSTSPPSHLLSVHLSRAPPPCGPNISMVWMNPTPLQLQKFKSMGRGQNMHIMYNNSA